MKEHVVLSLERYGELLRKENEYEKIKKRFDKAQDKVNRGDLLAIKCATDLYKLETQNIEQSLHLGSDAWSVISSEKLKMLREHGIEDSTIKTFLKRMNYQLRKYGRVL